MMIPSSLTRFAAAALAASLLASPASAAAEVRTVDRIVAVVNKQAITQQALDTRVREAEAQLTRQKVPLPPAGVLQQQMLERMINEEVQLQYAGNNGIALDSAELDRIMDRLAEQNRLTPEQFRARLKADGINEAA